MADPSAYLNVKPETKPSPDPLVEMENRLMTFITESLDKKMEQMKETTEKGKSKKNREAPDWNDPEFRKKVANIKCRNHERNGECNRTNCPYAPCNQYPKTYYIKDF